MNDEWVLIGKAAQETGYTVEAIRTKTKRNIWPYPSMWRYAPDNRKVINLSEVRRWMAGKASK